MTPKPSVTWTALAAAMAIAVSAYYGPQAQEAPPAAPDLERRALSPGDVLDARNVHLIERPGRYGLGLDLRGSRYAISEGYLIRVDPDSLQVLSVLRDNVSRPQ